jgi:PKD repeat protein
MTLKTTSMFGPGGILDRVIIRYWKIWNVIGIVLILSCLLMVGIASANAGNVSAILCLTGNSTGYITDSCGGHALLTYNISSSPIGAAYGDGALNFTAPVKCYIADATEQTYSFLHRNLTPWTIKFTFLGHTPPDNEFIFSTGTVTGARLYFDTSRRWNLQIFNGSTTTVNISTAIPADGAFHNITITFIPPAQYTIRDGGALIGRATINIITSNSATPSSPALYIGPQSSAIAHPNFYPDDLTFLNNTAIDGTVPMDTEYILNPTSFLTVNATSGTGTLAVHSTGSSIGNVNTTSYVFGYRNTAAGGGNDTWINGGTTTMPDLTLGLGIWEINFTASHAVGISTNITTVTVTSGLPPVANYTVDTSSGQIPHSVVFTDLSTEFPTSWNWSFGEGKYSELKNPTHTYVTAGKYTVSLNASNPNGYNISSNYRLINATAYYAFDGDSFTSSAWPGAGLHYFEMFWKNDPDNATHPYSLNIDGNGMTTSFGVSKISAHPDGTIRFFEYGINDIYYNVTAAKMATNYKAAYDSGIANGSEVYLLMPCPHDPLNKTWLSTAGQKIAIDDVVSNLTASGIPQRNIVLWYDAIDLIPGNGMFDGWNNTYYSTSDSTHPSALGMDVLGDYLWAQYTTPQILASFTSSGGPAVWWPNGKAFTDTSTGSPTAWTWTFGDGTTGTEQNPYHWWMPGLYQVQLNASTSTAYSLNSTWVVVL